MPPPPSSPSQSHLRKVQKLQEPAITKTVSLDSPYISTGNDVPVGSKSHMRGHFGGHARVEIHDNAAVDFKAVFNSGKNMIEGIQYSLKVSLHPGRK